MVRRWDIALTDIALTWGSELCLDLNAKGDPEPVRDNSMMMVSRTPLFSICEME